MHFLPSSVLSLKYVNLRGGFLHSADFRNRQIKAMESFLVLETASEADYLRRTFSLDLAKEQGNHS